MPSATLERTTPPILPTEAGKLDVKQSKDSDGWNSIFPDAFFRRLGTAAELFDETVRNVLDAYESNPSVFSPNEELLILQRLSLGSTFSLPGVADQAEVYKIEDQFQRIVRDRDFKFRSELGRQFANYRAEVAAQQYYAVDFGGYDLKPKIEYDGDVQIMAEYLVSSITGDGGRHASETKQQEAYRTLIYSADFRSFLSKTLSYKKQSLGQEFSTGLFAEFLVLSSPERFSHCVDVAKSIPDSQRTTFMNTFLATEFGDDYGDSILTIGEHASPEQSHRIFETVNKFRKRTYEFASWFRDYDPEFAEAIEKAMNERLVDALVALDTPAMDGALHVDVAPHRHNEGYVNEGTFMCDVGSLAEGIKIVENLEASMGLIHDAITADDVKVTRVVQGTEQFIMYRFTSETFGSALLYIRPEGAKGYDKEYEYGNRKGVEASISFIVNPRGPHHLRSDKDPDGVSIRFDREGRMADDSPFAEDRDPTNEHGTISADISSGLGNPGRMPVKIGRLIAAGNILRAARVGSHESLHHNTNHFNQAKYGRAGGFAKLAIYTAHMAEAMITLQSRGSHGSKYRGLPGVLKQAAVELVA